MAPPLSAPAPAAARPRAGSITRRLILWLTLGTVVMWCLGVGYASFASYRGLNAAFDQVLRQTALRILPLAADDAVGHESDDVRDIDRMMDSGGVHIGYELTAPGGRVLLRERNSPDLPFLSDQPPGFSTANGYRLFRRTDPASRLTITVVESMRDRHLALYRSVRAMMLPLLPLVALNIVLIWLAVRGAMRPIERLRADIAARDGRNLAPLDQTGQPRELRPIADAVGRLMDRLRHALDAERAFSANSAHELRTPIAGALAQTQRLIAASPDPAVQTRARDIEATLKRLSRLSDKLLQLSRADAGIGTAEAPVDLGPVLDIVLRDAAAHQDATHPGALRRIDYRPTDGGLSAPMDADAFAIALRNLLENALVHGPADEPVTIEVLPGSGDTGAAIRIVNGGPALPPGAQAELTRRFARGGSGAEGSGLGLAIVQAIVAQSGGALRLLSPAPGRKDGVAAELELPRLRKETAETTPRPRGDSAVSGGQ
ncbi:sensor histidine kinase [Acidimangrovimonas sediminis]|uniref:sensor histidine kinase n=1 Tax=Acidimangrovimonas sediminis TaxID=2056283 RepID=UPI000C804BA2|nr:ATP-binding protein [Acidimangrovimonas sediminis]